MDPVIYKFFVRTLVFPTLLYPNRFFHPIVIFLKPGGGTAGQTNIIIFILDFQENLKKIYFLKFFVQDWFSGGQGRGVSKVFGGVGGLV